VADDLASVPDELFDALTHADAWSLWREQPAELRSMYIRWVSKPRMASERRVRANDTAYYTVHGVLDKAMERPSVWKALLKILIDAVG